MPPRIMAAAEPSVLNAFRRHCVRHEHCATTARRSNHVFTTPFGVTAFDTVKAGRSLPSSGSCSTPFGVTAFDTRSSRVHEKTPTAVLNAFRRHCVRHLGDRPPPEARPRVLNAFRRHCV